MSAQAYSVIGQNWREKEDLFGIEKHRLTSYMVGGGAIMLTIIKVFIILFLLVGIGNILAIFKINQ